MKKTSLICALLIFFLTMPGFAQVVNKDTPIKGTWDFQPKLLWETDSAGEEFIASVRDLDILPNGNILLADSKNFKIYIFDGKGQFLSAFGKQGEGPGEIKRMHNIMIAGKYLVVVDDSRLHYFTHQGKFVKSVPYSNQLFPRAFISEDKFISAPYGARSDTKGPAKILIYDINKKTQKEFAQFTPFKKASTTEGNSRSRMSIAIVIGGLTPMMTIAYNKGKLIYGMSDEYYIEMVDIDGKKLGSFTLEGRDKTKISKAVKKQIFKRIMGPSPNVPQNMIDRIINGLPETATHFHSLQIAQNGLIYAFIPNQKTRHIQNMDIFSSQGKYLYKAQIKTSPGSILSRLNLSGNQLILIIENQEGELSLQKHQITLPPTTN